MRVLVVSEDVTERLRAVSALLLHGDVEVVEADSAEEARRRIIAEREVFDVLVVDGDLSIRGGFAVLYDLRARAELSGIAPARSLVMAAREQDRWLGAWAGANDVMIKPVDSFELAQRVMSLPDEPLAGYGDTASTQKQIAGATTTAPV